MGKPQFKLIDLHQNGDNAAVRCRQQSDELRKQSYWTIRQSDEMIAKTRDTINRTNERLRAAGTLPPKSKPEPKPAPEDPFLAWGELVINGSNGNRKRRADD